ncbi:MAG: transposase [Bacteroidales bacterium]|nr:transposase [Bacteroidales bacterium]
MKKGRNKELIQKRNEALCRRYYYWTELQRLRFDDTLKVLSEQEFFISEERIMAIIRECYTLCRESIVQSYLKKPRLKTDRYSLFPEKKKQ